jgi:hypothetical protein
MTIAWAIIIVAVLFLLDRHHLLKKALVATGFAAVLLAVGFAGVLGYKWLWGRWEAHQLVEQAKQFAAQNECFNPATGKVHPVDESGVACSGFEEVHQRGTPLPPMLPTCHPDQSGVTFTPIQPGLGPIPVGSVAGGENPCVVRESDTQENQSQGRETPLKQTRQPFRYTKYPNGYLVDELCSEPIGISGQHLCYPSEWQEWLKRLERQTAGEEADALDADSGTQGPGESTMQWDAEQRAVFYGCRPHSCGDARVYFIVAPRKRELDIIWRNEKGVTYLGPNASFLRTNNADEWLESLL